jgi:hypothetical protein
MATTTISPEKENKNKQTLKGAIIFFIIVAIIYFACGGSGDTKLTAEQQHKKRIEAQFSAWDGSHINLTKMIKQSMNDPGSYENVETKFFDMDTYVVVNQTYTGKNAYGGRVKAFVKAKIDTLGNVIEILDQQD